MVNYQNGKIYKITNDIDDEIYIGSTCQKLSVRMGGHRRSSLTSRDKDIKVYKHMNKLGVEHFKIYLVEYYPCSCREELHQREGELIRSIGTLNSKVSGRDMEQWYKDNIEICKKSFKIRYQKNKKELLSKVLCNLCSSSVSKCSLNRHKKSLKCIDIYDNLDKYDTDFVEFKPNI